jgi:hypothetical protein
MSSLIATGTPSSGPNEPSLAYRFADAVACVIISPRSYFIMAFRGGLQLRDSSNFPIRISHIYFTFENEKKFFF